MARWRTGSRTTACMAWLVGAALGCGGGNEAAPAASTTPFASPIATPTPAPTAAAPTAVTPVLPQTGLPTAGTIDPGAPAQPAVPNNTPIAATSNAYCQVQQALDDNCVACHDGQGTAGAPMALLTYADLQAPALSNPGLRVFDVVKARVHDRDRPMPPQAPLSAAELAIIDGWVDAGAPPATDPSCPNNVAPAPPENSWPEHCDEVYEISLARNGVPNTIPAGTESHPQVPVTAPWGNEQMQAIAWRGITDNPKVLHHWILYGPAREFIFGWAPGKDSNEAIPPDVGLYLPGGRLNIDVHYNNATGSQAETDASSFEICAVRRENFRPKTATVTQALSSRAIFVPPGAVGHEVTANCTHSGAPVRLLSASPHAHQTATHMRFTVEEASGESIVMIDGPFNFEEQTVLALNPPVVVEAGDTIVTTCTFTNPTDRLITFGDGTADEMCFNFAIYEPMGGLRCGGGLGLPGGFGR